MDWIEDTSIELMPGDWCLATTQQRFHLPDGIIFDVDFSVAAEYKLKSSMARNGLNHLLAGWCDPGWNNAELTLELHNINKYYSLKLCTGMKIGQIVLWRGEKVPDHASYATKGRYNNQAGATASKGVA
jgi:dCTP deaminase